MVAVTVTWYTGRREGICSVRAGAWAMNRPPPALVPTGRTESSGTRPQRASKRSPERAPQRRWAAANRSLSPCGVVPGEGRWSS